MEAIRASGHKKRWGRETEFLEGGAEMSQEDRKQSRSSKKAEEGRQAESQATAQSMLDGAVDRQAEAAQKLVSKLNPGLGNKYETAKMMRDIEGAKNVTTATGTPLHARCTKQLLTTQAGSTFLYSALFFSGRTESKCSTPRIRRSGTCFDAMLLA
ncbi:conserved unknown protein [Ectocarpus siliculosus]|uniref:Uncharacterized protein n=1 Tax=Ectocarpus siliculosus TaxID=2880 RepID=D7FTY4_ECTSI|nr:conserved unknown protein [Ectocarpus siliculosus]|eukprot:CBJ31511.1 conserved unknown protein [Ectocarpus siliculosus]